ncbi:CDP-diacylglycerol--glycerol-3-phosphate 3-phosphatidyltransferase [Candidatus Neomarinimicrobiota bacterium]
MIHHLPNFFTVIRILVTPLFIYLLFLRGENAYPWALAIFVVAGITDILDGYLARKLQVESKVGKMLDPVADKILVLSAFISFVTMDLIYLWMVILIILRDITITVMRYILEKQEMPMITSPKAKGKTAVQIVSVIIILAYLSMKSYQVTWFTNPVENLHLIIIIMYITVLFTLYTGVDYFITNRSAIRSLFRQHP